MHCLGLDRVSAARWLFVLLIPLLLPVAEAGQGNNAPFALDFSVSLRSAAAPNGKLLRRAAPNPITVKTSGLIEGSVPVNFVANVSVGTPPQTVSMIVDTNSADLLFIGANDPVCNSSSTPCYTGVFHTANSSTYKFLNNNFSTHFGDGSNATGDYANDTVKIGGVTIPEQKLAVARNGTIPDNILGIGYIGLEAASTEYSNLPITLYNNGSSNIVGYSIWFDAADSFSGRLAFGGVDTGKFNGTLETLPISMEQLTYNYVTIRMAGIAVTTSGDATNISNSSANVIADSGTSGFYFARAVVNDIGNAFGATYDEAYSVLTIAYDQMRNDSTMDLTFGATEIRVPLSNLVVPLNETHSAILVFSNGGDDLNIVGVPFFRSAYTVFDYSHNQVSLAPVVYSSNGNITLIGENGVGGLTSSATQTGSTNSSSNGGDTGGSGLSSSAKIGIGVGVGLGVPLLGALAAALFFWHRRKKAAAAPGGETFAADTKSELPADNIAGNSTAKKVGPAPELDGNATKPVAELGGHQDAPPQELPASMPEPQELPAEHHSAGVSGLSSTPVGSSSVSSPTPLIGRE